jgi:hypothetical protein
MVVQVLSGITFTKLIGMSVLALTRSKLLEASIDILSVTCDLTVLNRYTISACG